MLNLRTRKRSRSRTPARPPSPLGRGTKSAAGWLVAIGLLLGRLSAADTAAPPEILKEALASYRAEGPHGWSFTQKTVGAGHSRVEHYNAARPDFDRWSLLEQDGRTPTADERQAYHELLSRRSRGGTAPRLTDQLDLATLEVTAEDSERTTFRFRLKPGEDEDATARFLRATLVLHKPTRTIESLELASITSFAPMLGVRIAEMRTILRYSLPEGDRPSLLLSTETRLRGRAFLFKSLDADLTVTFSDHQKASRR